MGLDLSVRVYTDFKLDEKGRSTWRVIELGNLRNCWEFLEALQHFVELSNCTATYLYGSEFYKALKLVNNKDEIKLIKNFIKENSITNTDHEEYEIHAWW